MFEIEHPDITHVNQTGYTRDQWREIHNVDRDENDRDESED